MTGINEWVNVTVWILKENSYYAQNGLNGSCARNRGQLLLRTWFFLISFFFSQSQYHVLVSILVIKEETNKNLDLETRYQQRSKFPTIFLTVQPTYDQNLRVLPFTIF